MHKMDNGPGGMLRRPDEEWECELGRWVECEGSEGFSRGSKMESANPFLMNLYRHVTRRMSTDKETPWRTA